MRCEKCGGLIVYGGDEPRCVNCGRRPTPPSNPTITDSPEPHHLTAYREEQTTMPPLLPKRCNKKTCDNPKAPDSVSCEFHRDQKKAANQVWKDRQAQGLPKRKPGRKPRTPEPETPAATPPKEAWVRTRRPPITLAEPVLLNAPPARRMDLDGNVGTVLDGLIQQHEAELAMLRGTKDILERQGSKP